MRVAENHNFRDQNVDIKGAGRDVVQRMALAKKIEIAFRVKIHELHQQTVRRANQTGDRNRMIEQAGTPSGVSGYA